MDSSWLSDTAWGRVGTWLAFDGPAALGNHLWQSTLFALGIALLMLVLRRNSARVRYALWMVASLKFLLPFAALAMLGAQMWQPETVAPAADPPPVLAAAADLAVPMAPVTDHWQLLEQQMEAPMPALLRYSALFPLLALIWAIGACFVAGRWLLRWRAIRRTLRAAGATATIEFPAPVRVTAEALEPGIVGIMRPVLLLPDGMQARLTPEQLRSVLAHEQCHLHRRDNLTAALHMVVETLFWFHPLVWWIGARLIDERERACDEQVVREGHAPHSYAEAILRVCEHYLSSRLPCVSGVSGSDLRRRVESIVRNPVIARLGRSKKLLLAAIAGIAVATPIAAGIASWRALEGRSSYRNAMVQYWSVLDAAHGHVNAGNCTAPGATLARRQARLAADIRGVAAHDGDKALLLAVLANSASNARRLLAEGAARAGDSFLLEDSLMHIAADFGDAALLDVLRDAGFEVDGLAGAFGGGISAGARTPLMIAIASGRMDNVDWLLRNGADVNAANGSGSSALTFAMSTCKDQRLVTKLIEAGARPNEKDLKIAANLGFGLGAMAPAISTGAAPQRSPQSAFDLATAQARDVSAAFMRGKSCPGRSSEVWEAQIPLRATVAKLTAGDGETALHHAVMANSERDVRRLLAAGVPRADRSAILRAAVRFADPGVLQALSDAGFPLQGADGGPALVAAATDGRTDNVAWLIQRGADVKAAGVPPLMYALSCRSQILVDLLLQAGATPDATARQVARRYGLELPRSATRPGRARLDPPRGWASAAADDLLGNTLRGNSPSLYTEARADLDGDGYEDLATLFVAGDGSREGLFVKLSSRTPGSWDMAATVGHGSSMPGLVMGIGVQEPGTYASACARGYGTPCQPGEAAEIALEHPGIALFQFEGASSLVFWDKSTREFSRVWTSD